MKICIFYSWQSKYRDTCDKQISKALDKAVKELNQEQGDFGYVVKRGGGDVVGVEHIDNNIDEIINKEADIAIVDFTHNGPLPQKDAETGEWKKEKCAPNTNATYEGGKLEIALGAKQVFRVYNTAYGDLKTNLEMPFDMRQEHFPTEFCCTDEMGDEERRTIRETLKKGIKARIWECTHAFIEHQKVRYAPLVPMRNELQKQMYRTPFVPVEIYAGIEDKVANGKSFRLLGLPGLGKTRMVVEAFKGRDFDAYYCDCKECTNRDVMDSVESLMNHRGNRKQTIVLDNCSQRLCGNISDNIVEQGFNCQLITIHYDVRESVDSGIDCITFRVADNEGVVRGMVDNVEGMPNDIKDLIVGMSGGFPLMAKMMIDNYQKGIPISNVSKKDFFARMLGINDDNATDQDKLKVLTAFSIFKFIGLYGPQEKQGRFIAGNRIVANIRGSEDDNLQLFKDVYGEYGRTEILERQGNLVLMRLIPLAIYLCKSWFYRQSVESVTELIKQIKSHEDEGTRNMLIESLSRRITLLADVPLAKELNDGLTNPDRSPFLNEEVVLSSLGSRLFLAFSEVNPESCALAIRQLLWNKDDEFIRQMGEARRNIVWALDHLAFDRRSFRDAMLTLAKLSLVETEGNISNNSTGLFVDRFPILLPGTEVGLDERIKILEELNGNQRFRKLRQKALLRAMGMNSFYRSGGAEKQGMKKLKDYIPTYGEVRDYLHRCYKMYSETIQSQEDMERLANAITQNARQYYRQGYEDFLFAVLEEIAPTRDFSWDAMRDVLTHIKKYDVPQRQGHRADEIEKWLEKLTKTDFVTRYNNTSRDISMNYNLSIEEEQKIIADAYDKLAKEFVEQKLYDDDHTLQDILSGRCFYSNVFATALSKHAKDLGVFDDVLRRILHIVLSSQEAKDGDTILIYLTAHIDKQPLMDETYQEIRSSSKKYLLAPIFAIREEKEDVVSELFDMLARQEIEIDAFSGYFNYMPLMRFNVKYVAKRLIEVSEVGASIVMRHCKHLLFENETGDDEYQKMAKNCLMNINLKGVVMDDLMYIDCVERYLKRIHDEDVAMKIHSLMEEYIRAGESVHDNYYIGKLYRKILAKYKELLLPRVFEGLENDEYKYGWISYLNTSYTVLEEDEGKANYMVIPDEEWIRWMEAGETPAERAKVLVLFFAYSLNGKLNPSMVHILDKYYSKELMSNFSTRLHSFGWTGSGIPLYRSRIELDCGYRDALTHPEAKAWFEKDMKMWQGMIEEERLENAQESALYGEI